ncbi:transglutaminase N-terminal domain-containing protein [Schlesneria sp. DSM 10557]|uniref:transglutaminase family protein n=1 Tax=Schlesneria sp. DSM 10557 TaxID=3044399 RepID=UPI00359FBD32
MADLLLVNRIEHRTVYSYRQPVTLGQHRLVLRPREGHNLRVENMQIAISPRHEIQWAHDIYNNSVALVSFVESASTLEITSTVTVHRTFADEVPRNDATPRVPLPLNYDTLESHLVAAYQAVSYPDDVPQVQTWLNGLPAIRSSNDAESVLSDLCSTICQKIKYQRRYAKGVQSPAETINLSSGSCRDTATLMMDAARGLGLAARFASGYLDCPASEAGRAAMHAWTEVYLPIIGWRGYDPTLGEIVSRKHILVGVSHHPRGVMPVSGLFTGLTGDFINMTAQVKIENV